ncbi:MAG: VanW family protein [Ferruginibacter sp.]|nr:VanW family protein [Ferruginibacter sp.]
MINLRTLLTTSAKQKIKQALRNAVAILNTSYFKRATKQAQHNNYVCIKEIKQSLHNSSFSTAKKQNLQLAISKLNHLIIQPNQIFSFWHLVGNPSQKRGYVKSRAISGNELKQEVGGGLCQLSGLIYYLALHAGVQILERHHHSIDIYKDEERFTPLGSDATVVYGYKDLQFKNNLQQPIALSFTLLHDELIGTIKSSTPLQTLSITFNYTALENAVEVTTIISQGETVLSTQKNTYKKIL